MRNLTERQISMNWHLFGENGVNIRPAWAITNGSPNVTIAIVDGGFDKNHSVFTNGRCMANYSYYDFFQHEGTGQHGTSVTSSVSSCLDNDFDVIGINALSRILMIERGKGERGNNMEYNDAFIWAMGDPTICQRPGGSGMRCNAANPHKADIINASFGGATGSMALRRELLILVKWINKQNSIVVAASGNESTSADRSFPAAATGVISVGATTMEGKATYFSNWGETVEIVAPGERIPVAEQSRNMLASGTSNAAPQITGIVSLMRSVNPSLNWKTAIYFLQSTATRMGCDTYCGSEYEKINIVGKPDGEIRRRCQQDCCVDGKQICTPGRVNAGLAVQMAKDHASSGPPRVALVDAEQYYVALDLVQGKTQGNFTIYNVGGAAGRYIISSTDERLSFDKTNVELAAKGQPGDRINIQVTGPRDFNVESPIRIASPDSRRLDTFTDEMTIFAQPKNLGGVRDPRFSVP